MTIQSIDLSGSWRFKPADSEWGAIEVPSLWEAAGYLDLDGIAIYERQIDLDALSPAASLEFDAVADLCRVFVNGNLVGSHEVGFSPFVLDVTGVLGTGANSLRVEVEDPAAGTDLHLETIQGKQGWANRFFPSPPSLYLTYGGIWQPVRLVQHGPIYLSDLWCDMNPQSPSVDFVAENRSVEPIEAVATITAFGQTEDVILRIPASSTAEESVRFSGAGIERWSQESPHLYPVMARVMAGGQLSHERKITTGLRSFERIGDDFFLNGSPYRMRSALHQGFWPRGLYAADEELIASDIRLALDAGLNTLRTHLKAFEPAWLDAADAAGMLLHCDLPIGEPLNDATLSVESDFGKRCIIAAVEQVRRDRSRPSILMWSLMNEVGLRREELLSTPGYIDLVREIGESVRRLDPSRPWIENDWVSPSELLHSSDVRSPHWYGRANAEFASVLDQNLRETSEDSGPLLVTEFGEWGLPRREGGSEFWDHEGDLERLVAEAGWTEDFDSFAMQTQSLQGWADRTHAEQLRTAPHVLGFCLTEWTDVPHEMNGLVSLRRVPKDDAIEAFRPALSEVGLIAALDRYVLAEGEELTAKIFVSNWSKATCAASKVAVALASHSFSLDVPEIPPGGVADVGVVSIPAKKTGAGLVLTMDDKVAEYPVKVLPSLELPVMEIRGPLASSARSNPNTEVLVAFGPFDDQERLSLEDEAEGGRRIIVVAEEGPLPIFGETEPIPTTWGPTPFFFGKGGVFEGFLGPELFHCFPKSAIPFVAGTLAVVVAPPIGRWGAITATTSVGKGAITACLLPIASGLENGSGFERHVLSNLIQLVQEA